MWVINSYVLAFLWFLFVDNSGCWSNTSSREWRYTGYQENPLIRGNQGIMPTLIIVRVRLKRVQDLSKDMEANKCPTLSIMRARPSFFAPTKAPSSREVGFPTPSPVSSRLASPQRAFSGLIRSPSVQILDDNPLHLSISLTCSTISRETCY